MKTVLEFLFGVCVAIAVIYIYSTTGCTPPHVKEIGVDVQFDKSALDGGDYDAALSERK